MCPFLSLFRLFSVSASSLPPSFIRFLLRHSHLSYYTQHFSCPSAYLLITIQPEPSLIFRFNGTLTLSAVAWLRSPRFGFLMWKKWPDTCHVPVMSVCMMCGLCLFSTYFKYAFVVVSMTVAYVPAWKWTGSGWELKQCASHSVFSWAHEIDAIQTYTHNSRIDQIGKEPPTEMRTRKRHTRLSVNFSRCTLFKLRRCLFVVWMCAHCSRASEWWIESVIASILSLPRK